MINLEIHGKPIDYSNYSLQKLCWSNIIPYDIYSKCQNVEDLLFDCLDTNIVEEIADYYK